LVSLKREVAVENKVVVEWDYVCVCIEYALVVSNAIQTEEQFANQEVLHNRLVSIPILVQHVFLWLVLLLLILDCVVAIDDLDLP
jgi:hypothetical protein